MLEKLDVPFQLQSMHSSCKLQKKKIPSSFCQKSTSECVDLLRWDEKPREELSAMSHPCAFQRRSIYCQLVYFLQRHFSVLPAEFSFGLLLTYSFKSPIEMRHTASRNTTAYSSNNANRNSFSCQKEEKIIEA